MNIKNNKEVKYYLFIPFLCVLSYALFYLLRQNFNLISPLEGQGDIMIFYDAGRQIWKDPLRLYDVPGFYYTPFYAVFMAFSFSLLPLSLALYAHYFFLLFLSIFIIKEFDKILILANVHNVKHRILYHLIAFSSYAIYREFFYSQSKFLAALIILYILRREIESKKGLRERSLRFLIINFILLAFLLSIAPYLIYLVIIFIFYDIKINDIFKKANIQKYLLFIIIILVSNIILFLSIENFMDFISLFFKFPIGRNPNPLYQTFNLDIELIITFNLILLIFTLYITFFSKIDLIQKIGWFACLYMFLNTFSCQWVLISPIIIIIFIKVIDSEKPFNSIFYILGLLIIFVFNIIPTEQITYYKYLNFLPSGILEFIINFRYIVLFSICFGCILILEIKNFTVKKSERI